MCGGFGLEQYADCLHNYIKNVPNLTIINNKRNYFPERKSRIIKQKECSELFHRMNVPNCSTKECLNCETTRNYKTSVDSHYAKTKM